MEVESIFYKSLGSDDLVRCELCSRFCVISNGDVGFCGTQRNVDGKLFACNFGVFSSVNVDPIEKKPLYHFLPGSFTFSLGGFSCNMSCLNCQNYIISQDLGQDSQKINLLPDEVVKMASDNDCPSISWTYNEPTLHLQYILETAKKSKKQNIKNTLITNGYMSKKALETILPYIDAFNVDIKSINNTFYQKNCNTPIKPILDNIKTLYENKKHIELTNLLITDENTSKEDIEKLTDFIKNELGCEVPIHFSRFFPYYKMNDTPPTPVKYLYQAKEIAENKGLENVYLGNIMENQNSYCPQCGEEIVKRGRCRTTVKLKNGNCINCNNIANFILK